MKILVFVSKWVGLRCLDVLLTDFVDDEYEIIVMEPDAHLIIDKLNKYNYDLKVFEERYNVIKVQGGQIGLLNAR